MTVKNVVLEMAKIEFGTSFTSHSEVVSLVVKVRGRKEAAELRLYVTGNERRKTDRNNLHICDKVNVECRRKIEIVKGVLGAMKIDQRNSKTKVGL